jgi:small subunit ribosomal protein S1
MTGTVTKITDFGAFVELAPGVEGLIHISQLSHERVPNVEHVVKKGEVIQVKVLSIDSDRQRISLSMKALTEAPKREPRKGGRGGRDEPSVSRADDPEMRKLKARFSSNDLKGGLG